MKRVLIAGKKSYIGENFYNWLKFFPNEYDVKIVSTLDNEWEKEDFSKYDVVVNFAGIAHINKMTKEMESLFYSINCDLAVKMCSHAKKSGAKQFIHMSSMNVYGDYCDGIASIKETNPTSFYGKSKLKGDLEIHKLEDASFKVVSVRPPFVYGKDCKGNYNKISDITKKIKLFANYPNKKSMIYIDNLCEFLRLIIENECNGYYIPQNREIVSTIQLMKEIAKVNDKKIIFTRAFNWMISIMKKKNKMLKKAFCNDYCPLTLSNYFDWKYDVVGFEESIRHTEKGE